MRVVEAGSPGGTTVVGLHGWGASAYSFRHLLPLLAGAGLRGVALDLRGHGLSDKPTDAQSYGAAEMTRQVVNALNALDLTSAVLVGQSMGGALAIDVAGADPGRIRGVVLVAPVGFTPIRRISVARALKASRWLGGRVPRWAVRLLLQRVYGTLRTFDQRDVDEYWAAAQFAEWPRALFQLVNEFDWTRRPAERLRSIAGQLQVLFGERDKLIHAASALRRARMLTSEQVTVVAGGGHLLAEEAPEQVLLAIRRALGA